MILIATLVSCTPKAFRPSPEVTFEGNDLLFKGEKFTGILTEKFPQIETVRKTEYKNGRRDGWQEETNLNGQMVALNHYIKGKKNGVQKGWFPNGNRRFHYTYKNNKHHGEAWEWYYSGALSTFARFDHGNLLGKKSWRESGQIYMNYTFQKGQASGLPGTMLCYQVRNSEKIQNSVQSNQQKPKI